MGYPFVRGLKLSNQHPEPEPTGADAATVTQFFRIVAQCAANAEFVKQWSRLRGVRFGATPLEQMIDSATGFNDDIARMFIRDVHDFVWCRMRDEAQPVDARSAVGTTEPGKPSSISPIQIPPQEEEKP